MERMNHLTEDVSEAVVRTIAELQDGRSDGEIAALLGCSRSHWCHVKAGHRRVSYALLKRAAAVFPEVYPIVMRDLMGDTPEKVAV